MRKFLLRTLSVMVLYFPTAAFAQQQCDCDFVISTSPLDWMFDGAAKGVKPGDKICLASGTRLPIVFYNIKGSPGNPVTITNMCDGKVTLAGTGLNPYGIEVHKSSNFRVTGSGKTGEEYGIEIKGTVMGIDLRELSTDFEIDHLKITNLNYAGIVAKTDPTCDASTWRGNFTMRNTSFHHNYISDVGGEALYIGSSHYHTTVSLICLTGVKQVQEHEIIGVKIYNNIIKNTGNDGIQVGAATSQCYIHHNNIYNVGTSNGYGQQSGIQINPGTNADCYNNIIDKGTGYGIFAGGRGASHLYNNLITNHMQGGILAQDYPPVDPRGFIIANNTLINNKDYGIYMFSQNTSQNIFINNIIVAYNQSNYQYVKLNNPGGIKWTESNNIKTADIGTLRFANASNKDYRLTSASTAKDAGKNAQANGVIVDLDEIARPQGGLFDIGAYEFKNAAPANKPPVANAGTDKVITLPTSSIALTGTASDPDGSIASYTWSKVSGGAATLTNANTATLNVSGLAMGSYTFRLTVKDNSGATASDDVILIVNKAPTVNAGIDKTITLPINSASFGGSASDTDGSIASYTWTKIAGGTATLTNASTATLTVSGLTVGSYTFRLTAKDNRGATAYDDVLLNVNGSSGSNPPASNPGTGQIARFAFTNIAHNVAGWVELVGSPHTAVITKTDPATGYTVSSVSTAQWNPANYGTLMSSYNGGVDNGTVQPANVMKANWFNYNAPYGATVNGVLQKDNLSISGLNPSHKYKLQMGASRQTGAGNTDQYGVFRYIINGVSEKDLNVTNNTNVQVEFLNIAPNAQGKIGISARKISGSAMNFGYIGWLVITDLTTGTTTARTAEAPIAQSKFDTNDLQTEDGEFTFNDKTYAGSNYSIAVYSRQGDRVFSGKWTPDLFNVVFQPGEMYLYHVLHEGQRVDVGKIFIR